jgi:UDP-glucose:(heptosyl)LPS alpha-1,3-glucosyltransferase
VRIALIGESFEEARGGAERCGAALARALEARGHAVSRIARDSRAGRIAGQVALVRAAERARREHDVTVSLTRAPGDVLVPHGGPHLAAVAGALRRRGALGRAAGAAARLLSARQWAFLWAERAQLAGAPRRFVALSRMVRDDMARLWRADPARIDVVPNGVDLDRFRPPGAEERAAARARIGAVGDEVVLLLVSHNFALRGLGPLVRALARLEKRRFRLVVVGRGRGGRAARRARRLGVRIDFAGAAPDPRPFYHAADVLAHPTFYDPCSLVTLEALAAGLPVVTTRWNGAAEILTGHESAVLGDPRDAAALAAALAAFEPPAARNAAREAARETALAHPEAASLERIAAIVEDRP